MIRKIVKQEIIWFQIFKLGILRTFVNHALTHLSGYSYVVLSIIGYEHQKILLVNHPQKIFNEGNQWYFDMKSNHFGPVIPKS